MLAGVVHVGGLLIGVASGVTAVFLPAASEAIMYVLMAVILLVRPRGLLGEADIALEQELDKIDREWHNERDRYLMMSEFGGKKIPSKRRGLIAGTVLVGIAIGLFFMFQSLQPGLSRELGPYISGFVLLFGVGLGWMQYSKGLDYERAHAAYLARRNGVIARYKR